MNRKQVFGFLIILGLFLRASGAYAQDSDLSSPRATIISHLKYLQSGPQYQPKMAARSLRTEGNDEAWRLAVKLKEILDGKGLWVDAERIPSSPDYRDSISGLHRYVLFESHPDIFVEKVGNKWLYSKRTVEIIPSLHKSIYPLGGDFIERLFPASFHRIYMGLKLWQYAGMFIFVLAGVIIHKLLSRIIRGIIVKIARRTYHQETNLKSALITSRPLSLLLTTSLIVFFVPLLHLPIHVNQYVLMALRVLIPVFSTIFAYRLTDLLAIYFEKMAEKTENTLDDQLIPLVKKSLKIFILITGALFVLQQLNFNVTTILAGLSIGGLAFALAAQDTIKNLFGSLMIFLDRPFQIGDWIKSGEIDGTVEEVGFRSTRVRTFANSLVYVPNGKIADSTVDNMGRRVYRRFKTNLGIAYHTPPDVIEAFVEGLKGIVMHHPATRKDYFEIHMNAFNSASLDVLFYIFFDVANWSEELKARHDVILRIIRLAEALHVSFAFPTQTLHVETLPGQESLVPKYNANRDQLRETVENFLRENGSRDTGN